MPQTDITTLAKLEAFARDFADDLKGGEVVGLIGELGVGKTTFVQALARSLGIAKDVRSPTFILLQLFDVPPAKGRRIRHLCHVDAYRFKQEDELRAIGFEDYAGVADTVCVVEWAEKTPFLGLMKGYSELRFSLDSEGKRLVAANEFAD